LLSWQAQKVLDQTDIPLSDIALGCGFADQAHLRKQFRVVTGETPAAWRRAKKAQDADLAVLHSPCPRIRRSQCYFNMSARHVAHSSPRALAVESPQLIDRRMLCSRRLSDPVTHEARPSLFQQPPATHQNPFQAHGKKKRPRFNQ
jgi:hypothetical protein